jgi:hypothetical protein
MTVQNSEAPARRGVLAELQDAVSIRALTLIVGTLVLQLGFILSYVGALHHPVPHKASIGVVAPAQVQSQVVGKLNGIPGQPLNAKSVSSEADAISQIKDQKLYSAFIPAASGSQDRLVVASASGASLATAIERAVTAADAAEHRTVAVEDVVPIGASDQNGLSSFYLAVGWCVGGYLVASIIGISAGMRSRSTGRAVIRLGTLAIYSALAGILSAVIVGPVLGALSTSLFTLWAIGTLLVFAVGTVSLALQRFLGIAGIGAAVLLFVILGNPSSGGVYAPPMLPPFWRAIGPWLPNGAGTTLNRSYTYFGGTSATGPWLVLAAWALVGVVLLLAGSMIGRRQDSDAAEPMAVDAAGTTAA